MTVPSSEDEQHAFERVRQSSVTWDIEHPLRRFVLASERAIIAGGYLRTIVATMTKGNPLPVGQLDLALTELMTAVRMLLDERPDVPWSSRVGDSVRSALGIRQLTRADAEKLRWDYP